MLQTFVGLCFTPVVLVDLNMKTQTEHSGS